MLAVGTNTYPYGNPSAGSGQAQRLAQYQAAMQYFGADGLGSVRQLYDSSGQVVGSTRYDPYGNLMAQSGATSVFAFAGEQQDATGLEYLRARYYSAAQGRFVTRDVWEGNYALPGTLDHWVYVRDNPVNFLDPSGRIERSQVTQADDIYAYLRDTYQVHVQKDWRPYSIDYPATASRPAVSIPCMEPGAWKLHDLELVREAVDLAAGGRGFGDAGRFMRAMRYGVSIMRWDDSSNRSFAPWGAYSFLGDVVLTNLTFDGSDDKAKYDVLHELGHVWDHRSRNKLSAGMMEALGTWILKFWWDPYANPERPAGASPACTVDQYKRKAPGCENPPYAFTAGTDWAQLVTGPGWEDWAESFASFVYRDFHAALRQTNLAAGGVRENYVRQQTNAVR